MTEREAWLKLARDYRNLGGMKIVEQSFWGRDYSGICWCIDEWHASNPLAPVVISERVRSRMFKAIDKERLRLGKREDTYLWTKNKAGDAARARFCSRMARRCK